MADSSSTDLKDLNLQCVLDKVSITLDEDDATKIIGTGHLTFFVNENPVDKEVIVVRFSDDDDNDKANITLTSTSTAWLDSEKVLAFTRPQGGVWKVDCSQSEESSFKELLDILSFFIVFENRHQMRNMLVMIDPVTCEVMEVVAENVQLEAVDSSGNVKEEGELATQEDEIEGEKLPVCIEEPIIDEQTDVPKSRRVRILNRSANALLSGSTWIADTITQGGDVVAKQISTGGRMLEDSFDATESPIKLSDSSKSYFESAYNASASVRDTANGLTEKAASTTISTVSSTVSSVTKRSPSDEETPKELNEENAIDPNEETHFGKAALKSAAKVFGSIFKAKREVLKSTRESVVKVVHKKFGGDASMVVDRTLGTGYNLSCMMVYFDAKGVSRRVATKGAIQTAKKGKQKELEAQAAIKAEIPEVQAEIPAVQAEIPEVKAVE